MRIHQLSVDDALASLHSGPEGIGEAEAKRRLAEFGPNQVERVETTPLLTRFLLQFTHFFALILWLAAALALCAETQQPGAGRGALATAIVGVIVINGLFSFWQEYRSEQALSALRHLLPQMVAVERGGEKVLPRPRLPTSPLPPLSECIQGVHTIRFGSKHRTTRIFGPLTGSRNGTRTRVGLVRPYRLVA